jgi:hypothetical protein
MMRPGQRHAGSQHQVQSLFGQRRDIMSAQANNKKNDSGIRHGRQLDSQAAHRL